MPLAKYADRQHTLYLPCADGLKRWKKLSKPYTLNKWIYLMVEAAIESKTDVSHTSNDLAALRLENSRLGNDMLMLKQDNALLSARLKAKDTAFHDLDYEVVTLLKYRGGEEYISPEKIRSSLPSINSQRVTKEFIQDRLKSVDYTLAQLEAVGLIKKHWQGWRWLG